MAVATQHSKHPPQSAGGTALHPHTAPRLVSCRNDGRGEWAVLLLAWGWTPEQRGWNEPPCVGHVQRWGINARLLTPVDRQK